MIRLRLSILFLVVSVFLLCGCKSEANAPTTPSVTGRVILDGESDHSGVVVTLSGPTSAAAVTGADGTYAFADVLAGNYTLIASAKSTVEGTLSTALVVADAPSTASDLTFAPLGDVDGKATLGTEKGNAGIVVLAAGTSSVAVTDDAGKFTLHDVRTGSRDVIASFPGFDAAKSSLTVKYGTSTTIGDLSLKKTGDAPGSITGKVTLTGTTDASGVAITLTGARAGAFVTDASGSYAFSGLPDGAYAITAAAVSTSEGSASTTVTVKGGATSASDLSLTALGAIVGIVTLGGTTGNAGIVVYGSGGSAAAFTDDAGNYRIPSPVGSFTVSATKASYTTATVTAPAVTYKGTATAPAIVLSPDSSMTGSLAGVATLVGLTTFGGTTVAIDGTTFSTKTADDGSFTITGVTPGTYSVSFSNGAFEEHVTGALVLPSSKGFLVDAGTIVKFPSIVLARGKRLSKSVRTSRVVPSPDGKAFAFVDTAASPRALVVGTLTTGALLTVANGVIAENDFGYTPDGTHLLYRTDGSDLRVVAISGGTPISLASAVTSYAATADGKRVVWSTNDGTSIALQSAPIAGTPVTTLAPATSTSWGAKPFVLSPDGANVAYIDDKSALRVVAITGGTPSKIATYASQVQFSPDGKLVFFLGPTGLEWAPLDGSVVASGMGGVGLYRLYASGTKVLATASGGTYTLSVAGGPPTLLTTLTDARMSPNEKYLVFLATGGNLRMLPIGGGTSVALATAVNDVIGITPDSARVVFASDATFGPYAAKLQSVPIAGGTPTVLASKVGWEATLSPDGSRVAHPVTTGCDPSGVCAATVTSVPTTGGTATALVPDVAYGVSWWVGTSLVTMRTTSPYAFQNGIYLAAVP